MDEANLVGTAAAVHEMYTAPNFPNTFNITVRPCLSDGISFLTFCWTNEVAGLTNHGLEAGSRTHDAHVHMKSLNAKGAISILAIFGCGPKTVPGIMLSFGN